MTSVTTLLMVNAVALLAVIVLLWAYSVRIRDVSFIDAFWAFGMVLLAWASLGAIGGARRAVASAAWTDDFVGIAAVAASVDPLARAWRRPALCQDHGAA